MTVKMTPLAGPDRAPQKSSPYSDSLSLSITQDRGSSRLIRASRGKGWRIDRGFIAESITSSPEAPRHCITSLPVTATEAT